MALLNIRKDGDEILRKKSKDIKEIDEKILQLIEDMKETMVDAQGVGLAAPQVGKLRRLVIVELGEEPGDNPIAMINPEIVDQEGKEVALEGCLSIPGFTGSVERPKNIKLKYLNEQAKEVIIELEDFDARKVCHEIDHLDGILFKDKYIDEYILNEDGEYIKYE